MCFYRLIYGDVPPNPFMSDRDFYRSAVRCAGRVLLSSFPLSMHSPLSHDSPRALSHRAPPPEPV